MTKFLAIAFGLALSLSSASASAADVKAGKKIFNKCKACHSLVAGTKKVGPSLHGVLGNNAGQMAKFKYSKDVKAAGAKGLVWTPETFVAYIKKPKKYLGGLLGKKKAKTKMAFNGLKKAKDRDNLLAYLMTVTK